MENYLKTKEYERKKAGVLRFRPARICQTALNKQIYCKKKGKRATRKKKKGGGTSLLTLRSLKF